MNISYSVLITAMAMASHSHAAENKIRSGAADRLLKKSNRVVGRVQVVGSDAGFCQYRDKPNDCDANFSFNARQYEDGSVGGQAQDCWDDKCSKYLHGQVTCINFFEDKKAIVAIKVTGASDNNDYLIGVHFLVFASEGDGDGGGYNNIPDWPIKDCYDSDAVDNFFVYPHVTGTVKVQAPE